MKSEFRIIPAVILLFLLVFSTQIQAAIIEGKITNAQGTPVSFAAVYIKNSSFGVSADEKGRYSIQQGIGTHTLVFSSMGYKILEKRVVIHYVGEKVELNITLEDNSLELNEITINSKDKNRGKEIMQKAREKRKEYLDNIENYSCQNYQKISIEKEVKVKTVAKDTTAKPDGQKIDSSVVHKIKKKEKTKFIESFSTVYFMQPNKFKEVIEGYQDFANKKPQGRTSSLSYGITIGEPDIATNIFEGKNDNIVDYDPQSSDFNFYKALIQVPQISNKPLQSPLAPTADLSYRFHLEGSFYEDSQLIYKIHAEPIFKNEGLFEGTLYIEDSTWAIKSVDLKINSFALNTCTEFHLIQNYGNFGKGIYLPTRREYIYTINGDNKIFGNTLVEHSHYEVNTDMNPKLFTAEVKTYQPESFDKDTGYWNKKRPVLLNEVEEDYILETDSMNAIYATKEYLDSLDKDYNHLNIWSFLLTGIIHRNRYKKYDFYIYPLIAQLNPFGIGGYRHMIGANVSKEFHNQMTLETDELLNYGFRNRDLKWRVGAGLTYYPRKFVRTYVQVGDLYEMINTNAAFGQIFSRSNYVRSKSILVSQRMELLNGLYGEISFKYADQIPINPDQLESWSNNIFGTDLNKPTDFTRYIKSEFTLQLKYRIGQKYVIKKNKKYVIGKFYPELKFTYKKGIPGLFNSEVNYDYLEVGFHKEMKLARFGYSGLDASIGSFVNRKSLRVLEYKYFRGSDIGLFMDPLGSFQLLGYTFSTATGYFRVNYIHHFEGFFLDKIPVIRLLKLSLAAGGGVLMLQQNNFKHAEIYGGIERQFRIRSQLFRVGCYAVTADNKLEGANFTWKFGISFYDKYSGRWQ